MCSPSQLHYCAAKRVLRCIKGTTDYGIWYEAVENSRLIGYTDSDWARCLDDMKTTSGYTFFTWIRYVFWSTKKQNIVAESSTETVCSSCKDYFTSYMIQKNNGRYRWEALQLYWDNKSAIAIAENRVTNERTKHILIKYHYIREAVEHGEIKNGILSNWF